MNNHPTTQTKLIGLTRHEMDLIIQALATQRIRNMQTDCDAQKEKDMCALTVVFEAAKAEADRLTRADEAYDRWRNQTRQDQWERDEERATLRACDEEAY